MVTTGAMPEVLSLPRHAAKALTLLGLLPGTRTHLRRAWSGLTGPTDRAVRTSGNPGAPGWLAGARTFVPPDGRDARVRLTACPSLRVFSGNLPPDYRAGCPGRRNDVHRGPFGQDKAAWTRRDPGKRPVPQPARGPAGALVTPC